MAQRTIHYLIGELLLNEKIRDTNRFRVGNLLPDAYEGNGKRSRTHFTKKTLDPDSGRAVRFCDFGEFLRMFEHKAKTDDLYLGYYMHLVEDACFRVFWKENGLQSRINSAADVELLHRDYRLLNGYFVERYKIKNETFPLSTFDCEPINQIYPFLLDDFFREFDLDFTQRCEGTTTFLSGKMVDDFVSDYIGACKDALRRIQYGEPPLPSETFTW
ncbi:MAG: hypothetical protein PUB51_02430 [Oscillospiraceae bacterium]|nr:hypothetical protein [Oscillospiraceae bacterium]